MGKKSLRIFTPIVQPPASASASVERDQERDQINNLTQKERNLSQAGVTRLKYLTVIAEALEATKKVELPDAQGNYKWVEIADSPRRQWGAEQAAKLFGDMIERKEIEHDIGDKTLERFKAMSVEQLRARAKELIQTTRSKVLESRHSEQGEALPAPNVTEATEEEY